MHPDKAIWPVSIKTFQFNSIFSIWATQQLAWHKDHRIPPHWDKWRWKTSNVSKWWSRKLRHSWIWLQHGKSFLSGFYLTKIIWYLNINPTLYSKIVLCSPVWSPSSGNQWTLSYCKTTAAYVTAGFMWGLLCDCSLPLASGIMKVHPHSHYHLTCTAFLISS